MTVLITFGRRRLLTFGLAALWLAASVYGGTPPLPVISNQVFIVTNTAFAGGAYGNGVSNSAAAINSAISYAASHGGGTVEIPPVGTLTNYLSGPITLASRVNLQIDAGAMLQMLPRSSWPSASTPFIFGDSLTDVEISGSGTVDGQGTNWWCCPTASSRPHFIRFDHCTRVLIQNVRLQNPPTFTIYLKNSDTSVTVQGITIDTPFSSHNTDGFDISSTNVLIQNSYISTGDDNVEIGGSGAAATDITISNCTFGTGHGLSIGSYTGGGVNNLIVSNCSWNGTEYGIKMKTDRGRGGLIENLQYTDLIMTNVNFPFAFYENYNTLGSPSKTISVTPSDAASNSPQVVTSTTPIFRNVTISNLTAIGNSGIQGPGNIAGIIYGVPEMAISNITLCKVNIPGRGSRGTVCMYNVRDIRIIDSNLTAPLTGTNVLTLYNAQITITNSAANANLITIGGLAKPPTNNILSFFNARAAITDTNLLGTGPITLVGSSLTFNQASVSSFNSNISVLAGSTLIFTGGVNVINGTLSGDGVVRGSVTISGALVPGNGPGTLTVSNNLVVNGGAALQYDLGTIGDLTAVSSNLTLGGTLNVTDAGGFTDATYTLFSYGGTLTYNGLAIGSVPAGFDYVIYTGTVGQVNLIVSLPLSAFEQWQIQYFGSTNNAAADPNADPDGDGQNNQSEFESGTNPTNSASALQIISTVRQSNDVMITWTTAGGFTNAVQATAGGGSGGYTTNFSDISDLVIISGSGDATTNYTDAGGGTNVPSRYYRVRLVP
jgi:polygalacturonase